PAGAQEQGAGAGSGTGSGSGSGSESGSGSGSGSDAAAESVPESESAPDPEPASAEDDPLVAERAANSAAYVRQREAALERALSGARQDERDGHLWVPWAMTGTGVASVAAGLLIGALPTAACDDSCGRPFWPAWLVVGGAALATAGTIWLVINDHDQAELRFRRERIQQQLELERWNAKQSGRFSLTLSGRL
ncbi:MAG TPA: hypothetical protein VK509_06095, partial [Polyangiales bacterium]|nr:hypothetical protein [Polyangiales bacterium]